MRGFATLLCLCALLSGCWGATYSGPGWSGRVVDVETGGAIEGAIVVARWELEGYGGNFAGWLFVAEAVTDQDGIFRFPAWGPLKSPVESGMQTRMSPNVPDISIF
ncbi:MAG: carboxypeptidase-like regulatory domain-containing protein [Casimicrobiaceae bacterium]